MRRWIFTVILLVSFFLYHSSSPTPSQAVKTFSPKVYVLIFNPTLRTKNNQTLVAYRGWHNPEDQAVEFVNLVKEVSYNSVNYQIVGTKIVDRIPLKQDGYQYSEESYLACIDGTRPCHNQTPNEDFANYQKILSDYQICDIVNAGEIEELWMWGGPWFGFYESNMAGPDGWWTNGPVIQNTSCNRPIHIMGGNYERHVNLHAYGHRAEGTFNTFLPPVDTLGGWGQFRTSIGTHPTLSVFGCGQVHFPPNAMSDYNYGNTSVTSSNCDDWLNYPSLTGSTKQISCSAWNCTEDDFLKWWFKHLPSEWWSYIIAGNRALTPLPTATPTMSSRTTPTQPPTPIPTKIPTPTPLPPLPTLRLPRLRLPTLSFSNPRPPPVDSATPTPPSASPTPRDFFHRRFPRW